MVEDEMEEEGEAGPELPPDFDPEEDIPDDDEEGRFFGGGMDRQTAQAMSYIDEQEQGETAVCDIELYPDRSDTDFLVSLRSLIPLGCDDSP